ncbi:MAG: pyroglutamyl-peptidase I [Candidatus Latescibacteria bacterium]|nr:pyroglutamyl-peptidase I [Candidatus Latescibacterota bacterium]
MKILLTGFEPWAQWSTNPSGAVAESLDGAIIGGFEVISTVLPVVHGGDIAKVAPLIAEHRPAAVVSLGLHGSASDLHVERVAVNLKVVDGGDYSVVEGGPDAYFSTLPVRAMVKRMKKAEVPARLTYSAGTFLCNHIMYSVLHLVAENGLDISAGFIHVPPTPELVVELGRAQPSMALETIQTGVMAGVMAVAENLNVLAS